MAILKHIAVKNADYSEGQRYLIFKHDEKTGKPILDENWNMQFWDNYFLDGINCDAFTFDTECMELNARYGKNQNYDEIKSHHYIISYDPKDAADSGLTVERAQELGLEYAAKYFPGHQALVLYSLQSLKKKHLLRSQRFPGFSTVWTNPHWNNSTKLNKRCGKGEHSITINHYQAHGYHPLLCFDGMTGDLLKAELRDGTHYCSKDALQQLCI